MKKIKYKNKKNNNEFDLRSGNVLVVNKKVVPKKYKFDDILCEVGLVITGNRHIKLNITQSEAMDFVDHFNKICNGLVQDTGLEKLFYTFDDRIKKQTITIKMNEIKELHMPHFQEIENNDEYYLLKEITLSR